MSEKQSGLTAEAIDEVRRSDRSNARCFECAAANPQWVSINNGIYICLQCAGTHRSFGVQVSFVRSLEMDNLSEMHLKMLKYGGNQAFANFLALYHLHREPLETRYFTKAAQLYRDQLK